MAFQVNPIREVKFYEKYKDNNNEIVEFSVTFNFISSEDIDYVELRKKMEGKQKMTIEKKVEGKDGKKEITEIEIGTYNAFLYTLRTSLVDCEGIEDPDGKPLLIKDDKGKIIVANQIAIFEAIRMLPSGEEGQPTLMDKVTKAYIGQKEKNL